MMSKEELKTKTLTNLFDQAHQLIWFAVTKAQWPDQPVEKSRSPTRESDLQFNMSK